MYRRREIGQKIELFQTVLNPGQKTKRLLLEILIPQGLGNIYLKL